MATIRKISEFTGLSIATVSKALNGKSGVKPETRETILAAAQKLNYSPNLNARSLKSGRSKTLGILTEDFTVFNTPEIMDSIAVACEKAGYHYIIENMRFFKRYGNIPKDGNESAALVHSFVNDMVSKQVDGIIYLGCHSHQIVSLSEHKKQKIVCVYSISQDPSIPYIIYNDEKAAYEAAELLLSYGGMKTGMITGPADSIHTANRTLGYQEALFAHNVPYNPHLTKSGDWERNSGFTAGKELIREGVTAIFAHNDVMALGVLDYCNVNGIRVGRDIKLIGFDNREISTVCYPQLSTVALPLFEIGQTATRVILDILEGNGTPQTGAIILDCNIIERESTKGQETAD
jgi:LacI family transcriptional regulator